MKHEKAVKKLMPPKRPPKGFSRCGFILNSKGKIIEVVVPTEMFNEQFDNLNDQNIFFEIFEYIEDVNEE
jgi:hypothetical protein